VKINNNSSVNIGKLYQTYQNQLEKIDKKQEVNTPEQDKLQLSDQAKQIHQLIKETKDLPDIREEKIAQIQEQIAGNTYNVSPQQLAAKMLSSVKE
jgi:negative regulator of flagellin synthesis FlgM